MASPLTYILALYSLKKKTLGLPVGTSMTSPRGIKFIVVSCALFNIHKYLVWGEVIPRDDGIDIVFDELELRTEEVLIKEGFLHPNIGWMIDFMPGFPPSTNVVTYYPQVIPPPLRAWVKLKLLVRAWCSEKTKSLRNLVKMD